MVTLHPDITLQQARQIADLLDAKPVQDLRGNVVITPRNPARRGNIVTLPQCRHSDNDPLPPAA